MPTAKKTGGAKTAAKKTAPAPRGPKPKGDDFLAALITKPLGKFEGREVRKAGLEIPGAGGGLREALMFEPIELHAGQQFYVLLECVVDRIRFDPIKSKKEDTGANMRVHIAAVTEAGAAFVDASLGKEIIAEQRDRIQKLRDEAAGIQRLPGTDGS